MIKRYRFLVLSVLALMVLPFTGHASDELLKVFDKPLPEWELPTKEEFAAQTSLYQEVPVGAREFSYDIRLPKNWSQADDVSLGSLVISQKIFSTLAKYYGPQTLGTRHSMTVQAIGVPYQMTAKHWLVKYLLDKKYNVQGVRVHDERKVEGLYIYVLNNVSYVVRGLAQINGKNVVLVEHIVPLEEWQDNKIMQAQVLNSFVLKHKDDQPVEDMAQHKFLDLAVFDYPEAWTLKVQPIRSADRLHASVSNFNSRVKVSGKQNVLDGKVGLDLVSVFGAEDIDEELESYREKLARRGLFVQDELSDHTEFVFDSEDAIAETYVYEVLDKHRSIQGMEFWVSVQAYGDYYYYTTLLTPARDVDFFKWSRNTQTYKTVTKSFRSQK